MRWIPRRAFVALLIVLGVIPRDAHATWSIVVLDRTHKWIGVAGASCTPDVYGIMSLRPGHGVFAPGALDRVRWTAEPDHIRGRSATGIAKVFPPVQTLPYPL